MQSTLNAKFLNTNEFAGILGVKGATVRRGLCVHGHYMGIKPVKMPNRRLLWPKDDAILLLCRDQNINSPDESTDRDAVKIF